MNFLAHAYLSFNSPPILVGNIISDFIKGKKQYDYPAPILQGIQLHRKIDTFTDFHPVTQAAKLFFKPAYRLYSGAFVDVVFDHFLANDKDAFHNEKELSEFCIKTYDDLQLYYDVLPEKFQQMLPYMRSQNWLYNYRLTAGIEKSFRGLVSRAAYLDDSAAANEIFSLHYDELKSCYDAFFPSLKAYTLQELNLMNNS